MPVSPYLKRSPELVEYSKGLKNIAVPEKFQVSEAGALFEIWAQDGVLWASMSLLMSSAFSS